MGLLPRFRGKARKGQPTVKSMPRNDDKEIRWSDNQVKSHTYCQGDTERTLGMYGRNDQLGKFVGGKAVRVTIVQF